MLLPLLWKDIRLNQYVIALSVFMVDTPYLTTAFGLSAFTGDNESGTLLSERLGIAFPFSLLFLAIVSGFIGGGPLTAEKADQTDRFLDFLPPSRLEVIGSKVLVALGVFLLAWAGPLIVYFTSVRPAIAGSAAVGGATVLLYQAVAASLTLFGLAWLASLYVRSAAICGLSALVGWLVVVLAVRRSPLSYDHGSFNAGHMADAMIWVGLAVAIVSLLAGVGLFLRMSQD